MKTRNGFRINKNGKVIISEQGEKKHATYKGASYKDNGVYYFFKRNFNGYYIYNN